MENSKQMNKDYTHIIVVLDRSGSMDVVRDDTIGGFNTFIKEQKSKPGKATITLAQFSHKYSLVMDMKPLSETNLLTKKTYQPNGYTALHDAVCKTIDNVGRQLSDMPEHERPGLVMCVIITDGGENASREFGFEDVKKRIDTQTNDYKWQFVFIGANVDAFAVGNQFGIKQGNILQYTQNAVGTKCAFSSLSNNTADYRRMSASGQSLNAKDFFDQRDRDAQAKSKVGKI